MLFCLLMAVCCVACKSSEDVKSKEIVVYCVAGTGVIVKPDDSFIDVPYGEEYSLEFDLEEGYAISNIESKEADVFVVNEDGKYYAKAKIYGPTTINIEAIELEVFKCQTIPSTDSNSISINKKQYKKIEDDCVYEGDIVEIISTMSNFYCWTKDNTLQNGGEIVSYGNNYKYEVHSDMILYENSLDLSKKYFRYYLNGGRIDNSSDTDFYIEARANYRWRYNTYTALELKREGYILECWNTKADGTGERIGLGSRATISNDGLELYAIWVKESSIDNLEYIEEDGNISIVKVNDNSKTVVIPECIGGAQVTKIKSNAFNNLSNLEKVVFPKTIIEVETNAFVSCTKLESFVFSDSLMEISDGSFNNTSPKYLFVNAVLPPKNTQMYGMKLMDCVDRVLLSDKPNIILQGGSSCAFGFDSNLLEELMGDEYTVTNFGWNAFRPMAFLMGITSHIAKAGDIYIHAGEIDFNAQYCTDRNFQSCLWGICEGNYDVFSWVDISEMNGVFDKYKDYNRERGYFVNASYDEGNPYAANGDVKEYRANTTTPLDSLHFYLLDDSVFSEDGFALMKKYYHLMQTNGVKTYESFGTLNKDALANDDDSLNHIEEVLSSNIDWPLISKIKDYCFDNCYTDGGNMHHLSSEGAVLRTQQLYQDLMAQFEKENANA